MNEQTTHVNGRKYRKQNVSFITTRLCIVSLLHTRITNMSENYVFEIQFIISKDKSFSSYFDLI